MLLPKAVRLDITSCRVSLGEIFESVELSRLSAELEAGPSRGVMRGPWPPTVSSRTAFEGVVGEREDPDDDRGGSEESVDEALDFLACFGEVSGSPSRRSPPSARRKAFREDLAPASSLTDFRASGTSAAPLPSLRWSAVLPPEQP